MESSLPPPPPGIDLSENRGPTLIGASISTWTLAILAVVLRLIGRRLNKVPFWIDDWLVIASVLVVSLSVFGLGVYPVTYGFGKHIWMADPDVGRSFYLGLFLSEVGFTVGYVFVKWSILAFYWRSFHVRRSIKVPIWTLATINLFWGVAILLVTVFQCRPIHAFWDRVAVHNPMPPSAYTCSIDNRKFWLGVAIPTIITDLCTMLLPLPYIYALQLRLGQKIALAGIFCVGTFVTIVSIIRLRFLMTVDLSNVDSTWTQVDICVWAVVEPNIAIVCACMPFMRPVLSKITFGAISLSSLRSGSKTNKLSNMHGLAGSQKQVPGNRYGHLTTIVNTKGDDESDESPFVLVPKAETNTSSKTDDQSIELNFVRDGSHSHGHGIVVTKEFQLEKELVDAGK